ncbi:MAG: hypothetical protein A2087_06255 [Spirochaetes bacterium GWD1_61_31]|nr:MAG: hypothetical protein A2Y37_01110 [Spirochaetes bacterium GWB1_60_80]OHD35228.1 MAG: hypothetical protein A2004_11265 [Spirochaetes bacterium GWC1_61_12]OHD41802.1 MAG: hypothetical protein A2087_06255 [Spirochaetes bacterium GWD1_61_31]OHD42606.1 MAG: hypothetical protein A2Y35_07780 [Spirochaetes bacterium GWE1_60_18]OHD59827.1 MAG: hypothetical protein A2Y32_01540 [Spirochaetes bacterium GWF1_60_12]HAP44155.1 4-alpha-glucanotransferase [Spirochaetaceae bacterium]
MNTAKHLERMAGVAVPLGGIRTAGGWAVGEYPDLVPFGALAKAAGLKLVQVLPLNDSGRQSSPYAALSAFALHPLYLRVADLPETAAHQANPACRSALATLAAFVRIVAAGRYYDYYAAYDAKLAALQVIYEIAADTIATDPELAAFVAARPWLRTYAVYKRLKLRNGDRSWRDWTQYTYPTRAAIDALWNDPAAGREHRFFAWLQLRCHQQLTAASGGLAELGLGLLGDLPILMNDDSADVWADRQLFLMHLRAGAPPEGEADLGQADLGQNWGFPVYDWDRLASSDYAFWRDRVRAAAAYYSSYRIDHVLGFFRIWALSEYETDGYLGYYVPGHSLSRSELNAAGLSDDRLRWLSVPHLAGERLRSVLAPAGLYAADLKLPTGLPGGSSGSLLHRIGDEDLYLFDQAIRGSRDLEACALPSAVTDGLKQGWRDRCLLRIGSDEFVPTARFYAASSWQTLSWEEKQRLEGLFRAKMQANDGLWGERGRRILSVLTESSTMLPCAEDLGAIPPCVPTVLQELGILGLRIPRWTRHYDRAGAPFVTPADYPALSVCAFSVHDTSTFRAWWETEHGREDLARVLLPELSPVPADLTPAIQASLMQRLSRTTAVILMAQLQDYTDMLPAYRSVNPADDRVNVPGTQLASNWTWRMPMSVETLAADPAFLDSVQQISRRS